MGAPVGQSVMFGDNESVIKSTTVPQSRFNKRHCALTFHRSEIRAIAAGISCLSSIFLGKENPADIVE